MRHTRAGPGKVERGVASSLTGNERERTREDAVGNRTGCTIFQPKEEAYYAKEVASKTLVLATSSRVG